MGAQPYLVVGLGNPGERYRNNRHNIGFRCVERLAREHGIVLNKKRFKAVWGQGQIAGQSVILAMPQTYMNDGGPRGAAAQPLVQRFRRSASWWCTTTWICHRRGAPTPGGSSRGTAVSSRSSPPWACARSAAAYRHRPPRVWYPLTVLNDISAAGAPAAGGMRCGGGRHRVLTHGIREAMNQFNGLATRAAEAEDMR